MNFNNNTDENGFEIIIPPKQAFLYFPSIEEQVEFSEKKPYKTFRRIFDGATDFTSFEIEKIEEMKAYIPTHNQTSNVKITDNTFPDSELLRILQGVEYRIPDACVELSRYIEWLKMYYPPHMNDKALEVLNLGFIYTFGRDHRFRPNICINVNVWLDHNRAYTFSEFTNGTLYMLNYVVNNCLIKGQVENWNLIVDVGRVSVTSIPQELKDIVKILGDSYRCRTNTIFLIGLGGFVTFMWKVVKGMIDKSTEKKIKILSGSSRKEMFEIMNKEQLEQKFGGSARNADIFFPPHFPSNNYAVIKEDINRILISENQAIVKMKNDSRIARNPYLLPPEPIVIKKESVKMPVPINQSNSNLQNQFINQHNIIHEVDEDESKQFNNNMEANTNNNNNQYLLNAIENNIQYQNFNQEAIISNLVNNNLSSNINYAQHQNFNQDYNNSNVMNNFNSRPPIMQSLTENSEYIPSNEVLNLKVCYNPGKEDNQFNYNSYGQQFGQIYENAGYNQLNMNEPVNNALIQNQNQFIVQQPNYNLGDIKYLQPTKNKRSSKFFSNGQFNQLAPKKRSTNRLKFSQKKLNYLSGDRPQMYFKRFINNKPKRNFTNSQIDKKIDNIPKLIPSSGALKDQLSRNKNVKKIVSNPNRYENDPIYENRTTSVCCGDASKCIIF